ncbi:MAG: hypothetical protein ABI863_01695 [Ginsengibacter sp.]
MDINRNNYEEYFLLYADNELTDFEKAEVLMFLKQNKDLEEEFRMIHHTICKPDGNIELADKSFLLRGNEGSFINEKNCEEVFVLYHDNELTDKQKKETGNFLLLHPQLKNEFELIGLARLIPDKSVIFPNKKKLYRKEKAGKVVPIIFWRALVAAVFIGSGLWITQLYIQKGKEKPGVVIQPARTNQLKPAIGGNVLPVKKPANAIVQSPVRNSQPSRTAINEKEKLQKSLLQKNSNNTLVKTTARTHKSSQENLTDQAQEKIDKEVVTPDDKEVATANDKIKNISKEQIAGDNTIEPSKDLAQNNIGVNENVQSVMYAQNASYVQDVNNNGQNYVFYDITTEEFKRTKVSSFLKKVKRVIARNNPISRLLSGEERQVVSN